jgi:hypothetical protein
VKTPGEDGELTRALSEAYIFADAISASEEASTLAGSYIEFVTMTSEDIPL